MAKENIRRAVDQTRSLAAELRHTHEEELEDGLPAALEALVHTAYRAATHRSPSCRSVRSGFVFGMEACAA